MAGSGQLAALVEGLTAGRRPGRYAWVDGAVAGAHAVVVEDEGPCSVVADPHGGWAWLTLAVSSPLELVGLTALVSAALAEAGIACNVLAGRHHDHLLVPVDRAQDALEAIAGVGRG